MSSLRGAPVAERKVERHPVQKPTGRGQSLINKAVTMRAYEVYCRIYGEQAALVAGGCRGGFGTSELIALLYARTFSEAEWHQREREAFDGMENL